MWAPRWVVRRGQKRRHLVLFQTDDELHIACSRNLRIVESRPATRDDPACRDCARSL